MAANNNWQQAPAHLDVPCSNSFSFDPFLGHEDADVGGCWYYGYQGQESKLCHGWSSSQQMYGPTSPHSQPELRRVPSSAVAVGDGFPLPQHPAKGGTCDIAFQNLQPAQRTLEWGQNVGVVSLPEFQFYQQELWKEPAVEVLPSTNPNLKWSSPLVTALYQAEVSIKTLLCSVHLH